MKLINILSDTYFENKKVLEKLITFYTWLSKEQIFMDIEKEIDDEDFKKIKASYDEYFFDKKPLEYIFWYVEFFSNKFKVNQHTLIPRPETEYMIQSINDFLKNSNKKYILCDIWTWCWVLGLSTLLFNKDKITDAVMTDITDESLEVARKNHQNLIKNKKIILLKTDLFSFEKEIEQKFENKDILLVANLPYIPDGMFDTNVEDNVKKWEPKFAFVWWEDWADLYRRMFDQIIEFKSKHWWNFTMFLEMLDSQANMLADEYKGKFEFEKVATFHFNIKILKAIY